MRSLIANWPRPRSIFPSWNCCLTAALPWEPNQPFAAICAIIVADAKRAADLVRGWLLRSAEASWFRDETCHRRKGDKAMIMRKWKSVAFLMILSLAVSVSTSVLAAPSKVDEERQEVRKMTKDVLPGLYKAQPSAKAAVSKAAGYAVFSNFGMKIFVLGSGTGKGIATDPKTKKETFMKMIELQTGLGFGVKKFSLVWVFEKPQALATFVNSGWELGTQASAVANGGATGAGFHGGVV